MGSSFGEKWANVGMNEHEDALRWGEGMVGRARYVRRRVSEFIGINRR